MGLHPALLHQDLPQLALGVVLLLKQSLIHVLQFQIPMQHQDLADAHQLDRDKGIEILRGNPAVLHAQLPQHQGVIRLFPHGLSQLGGGEQPRFVEGFPQTDLKLFLVGCS